MLGFRGQRLVFLRSPWTAALEGVVQRLARSVGNSTVGDERGGRAAAERAVLDIRFSRAGGEGNESELALRLGLAEGRAELQW